MVCSQLFLNRLSITQHIMFSIFFPLELTVSGEPQTQPFNIVATLGWILFGGHLLLDLVFVVWLVFLCIIIDKIFI